MTRSIEGRDYQWVFLPGDSPDLCVHFSAFFGEWGRQAAYRRDFFGFFHRLRMFWPKSEYTFLFVCDTFGADRNGTYYKGESMDFFVERAMDRILREHEAHARSVVGLGSSMGATAALRFALQRQWRGAVGVVPHIDLDICADRQDRWRHVAAVLGVEDVLAERHYPVTREIRNLARSGVDLPRVVLQSCRDDVGVHHEQVIPLVEGLRQRGGHVSLDERPKGGHTSEYATSDWFGAAIRWCLSDGASAPARGVLRPDSPNVVQLGEEPRVALDQRPDV